MNYLAHLFLSDDDDEARLGNLAGDFVKGALGDRFPAAMAAGITHHRRIDAFTDSHIAVAAIRALLFPDYGHYGRIITDLFLDHFLAGAWDDYCAESLESFLTRVWSGIDLHIHAAPPRLRQLIPRIRDEEWLLSYRHIDGIRTALFHLSSRLSRRPRLDVAVRHLSASRDLLENEFRRFMPDVIAYSNQISLRGTMPRTVGYTLQFTDREGYLCAYVWGDVESVSASLGYWKKVAAECKRRNVRAVLVVENFKTSVSIADTYEVASALPEMFRGVRVAFVDQAAKDFETNRFGETVAHNRGASGHVFRDEASAAEWLVSDRD